MRVAERGLFRAAVMASDMIFPRWECVCGYFPTASTELDVGTRYLAYKYSELAAHPTLGSLAKPW